MRRLRATPAVADEERQCDDPALGSRIAYLVQVAAQATRRREGASAGAMLGARALKADERLRTCKSQPEQEEKKKRGKKEQREKEDEARARTREDEATVSRLWVPQKRCAAGGRGGSSSGKAGRGATDGHEDLFAEALRKKLGGWRDERAAVPTERRRRARRGRTEQLVRDDAEREGAAARLPAARPDVAATIDDLAESFCRRRSHSSSGSEHTATTLQDHDLQDRGNAELQTLMQTESLCNGEFESRAGGSSGDWAAIAPNSPMACFLTATAGSLVRRGQVSQAEAPCRWQGVPRGSRPADWPGREKTAEEEDLPTHLMLEGADANQLSSRAAPACGSDWWDSKAARKHCRAKVWSIRRKPLPLARQFSWGLAPQIDQMAAKTETQIPTEPKAEQRSQSAAASRQADDEEVRVGPPLAAHGYASSAEACGAQASGCTST